MNKIIFILILILCFDVGCEFPRDPRNTFHLIKQRGLNVGVVHAPPLTDISKTPIEGEEIELLKRFADHYSLDIKFKILGLENSLEALKQHQVDVLIGGFRSTFPYKDVGLTRPYKEDNVMIVVQGENLFLTKLEKFLAKVQGTKK